MRLCRKPQWLAAAVDQIEDMEAPADVDPSVRAVSVGEEEWTHLLRCGKLMEMDGDSM